MGGWQQVAPEPDPEWEPVGSIKGPPGEPGPEGPAGPQGPIGNEPDLMDLTTLFENGLL